MARAAREKQSHRRRRTKADVYWARLRLRRRQQERKAWERTRESTTSAGTMSVRVVETGRRQTGEE